MMFLVLSVLVCLADLHHIPVVFYLAWVGVAIYFSAYAKMGKDHREWRYRMMNWEKLDFCPKCQLLFDPKTGQSASLDNLNSLLSPITPITPPAKVREYVERRGETRFTWL